MIRFIDDRAIFGRLGLASLLVCMMAIVSPAQDAAESVEQTVAQDDTEGTQAADLESLQDKASYAIGFNFGSEVSNEQFGLNVDMVIRGIIDASAGRDNVLSDEEIIAVMQAFQAEVEARQMAAFEELAATNKAEGEAFLAANGEKDGVETLENGLQYRVISSGEGESPTKESFVKVHYQGTFPDGNEFDSSIARGEPATFNVSGVIRGWTEILPMMKVGDKWQVFIPGELAYGSDPNFLPPDIGPNQVLVFEIELLEIVQ